MLKILPLPPIELLRDTLDYSLTTGRFFWRKNVSNHIKAGMEAGHRSTSGYWVIKVKYQKIMAQRIAWALVTGDDPFPDQVDHRNGITDCNSWINLRRADQSQQNYNQKPKPRNTVGIPGVRDICGRWYARICVRGRVYHLGVFDKYEEAVAARRAAEKLHHGEYQYIKSRGLDQLHAQEAPHL